MKSPPQGANLVIRRHDPGRTMRRALQICRSCGCGFVVRVTIACRCLRTDPGNEPRRGDLVKGGDGVDPHPLAADAADKPNNAHKTALLVFWIGSDPKRVKKAERRERGESSGRGLAFEPQEGGNQAANGRLQETRQNAPGRFGGYPRTGFVRRANGSQRQHTAGRPRGLV